MADSLPDLRQRSGRLVADRVLNLVLRLVSGLARLVPCVSGRLRPLVLGVLRALGDLIRGLSGLAGHVVGGVLGLPVVVIVAAGGSSERDGAGGDRRDEGPDPEWLHALTSRIGVLPRCDPGKPAP